MATTSEARGTLLLRVSGIGQLVQVCSSGERLLKGAAMREISVMDSQREGKFSGISIIVNTAGNIANIGYDDEIDAKYSSDMFENVISANGCAVIPGFVDGHTHTVWSGDRVHEFAMKLRGASYMDIHAQGGGIYSTVLATTLSSKESLVSSLSKRLTAMFAYGTTTVESKSGYGLSLESEVKMLEVIDEVRKTHPMTLSVTYCGAHAIPEGSNAEDATHDIINEQIPAIASLCSSGELHVDNIDVFCEKGVFDTEQSRRILLAGKEAGWRMNFHGDELHPMKSGELAGELGAEAVSHLEEVSSEGIAAMAEAETVAVLLPTTAYILKLRQPPARAMIEAGMAVALGSDFNPNAYCMSMPIVMHLACVNLGLTMDEALAAATINSAASLGLSYEVGSIEVGKKADFIILKQEKWENIIYQFGCTDQCIRHVIKSGQVVYDA